MCNYFRTLRADEIEVRVQQVKKATSGTVYAQLLLYKDARVDMMLLDEHFGIFGWQREHFFKDGKNYCRVSVYDEKKGIWVVKEDVGTPSNTATDKGCASDAFKRAAVNLGIGRELYTSPRIILELGKGDYYESNDNKGNVVCKLSTRLQFSVNAIHYNARREICALEIVDNSGRTRFKQGEIHDALYYAKSEMNNVQSKREADGVWRKYPEYHDEAGFISAYNQKQNA